MRLVENWRDREGNICDMAKTDESIGSRLKRIRLERGLTQVDLARKAGVSQSTVSVVESDQRVHRPDLFRLADALNIDVHTLRTGEERPISTDSRINSVVRLMRGMSIAGRSILLERAKEIAEEHPIHGAKS